jgi:hypothetical protein
MRYGQRGHNAVVRLEHQCRRPGFILQPTLQIRRRHLHRHRPIRQSSSSIGVAVTLVEDVITAVTVTPRASDLA